MKKFLGTLILVLMFCNIALAESSLPSCKGTDSFKWTNCFGTEKKNIAYDPLYKDQYKNKKILYEGEYRSGKFHGQGTITYPDGIKYVGELKYNKPNGQGIITFSNGIKYVGEFKYGLLNGLGTATYPNGKKYIGQFKGGNYHGQGT